MYVYVCTCVHKQHVLLMRDQNLSIIFTIWNYLTPQSTKRRANESINWYTVQKHIHTDNSMENNSPSTEWKLKPRLPIRFTTYSSPPKWFKAYVWMNRLRMMFRTNGIDLKPSACVMHDLIIIMNSSTKSTQKCIYGKWGARQCQEIINDDSFFFLFHSFVEYKHFCCTKSLLFFFCFKFGKDGIPFNWIHNCYDDGFFFVLSLIIIFF